MLNSKINLFGQNWIDTIFEGRNKKYGAYEIRRKESVITIKATIIGSLIFASIITLPFIAKQITSNRDSGGKTLSDTLIVVNLDPLPEDKPKDQELPPPPPEPVVKSLQDVVKFTPPVVAPDEEVVEEMVSQEVLKDKIAGGQNIEGDESGELVIIETPSTHTVEARVVEAEDPVPVAAVEVAPTFPGGMEKFDEYIMRNISRDLEGVEGILRVNISFVVEKDGSITAVKILRDGGFPAIARDIAKVFEKMPKWNAGMTNGRAVRVMYIKPVVIKVQ